MTYDEQTALRSMSERDIRRAQRLVHAQIPMAHKQGNERALSQLQAWDNAYAAEMLRRLTGGDS